MSSKVCRTCGEEKSLNSFYCRQKSNGPYYNLDCKVCFSYRNRDYRDLNAEQVRAVEKAYWAENKEKNRQKNKRFYNLNKPFYKAKSANRRATKRQATPPWLSKKHKKEIQNLFWLAQDLRSVTGEEYHVDHIVPLTNEIVCGLHVPWNLQILPSDINLSKSNSFDDQEEGLNYAH
jgi:hypothetical protein